MKIYEYNNLIYIETIVSDKNIWICKSKHALILKSCKVWTLSIAIQNDLG